jgi:hypothetical protein
VGKPEGTDHQKEESFKKEVKSGVDWIELAQDRDR